MADDPTIPMLIRLPRGLVELLDAYRSAQPDLPVRQEAIRRILDEVLNAHGQIRRTES